MTREEAIEVLQASSIKQMSLTKIIVDGKYLSVKVALEMAIKALEQEPCEDAISKQAVIDLVVANHTELNGLNVVMYAPFYKDIIQLPSVISQPKTGHWKRIGYDIYECSICGQDVMTGDICAYKHCHGCGAKMESEGKE